MSISDIWRLPLRIGESDHPAHGACAMDAVSWLVEGHLGDYPKCVCPVYTDFVINLNDTLDDSERQHLRTYLLRFIDTVDQPSELARTLFIMYHMMNVQVPLMLLDQQRREHRPYHRSLNEDMADWCRTWRLPTNDVHGIVNCLPRPEVTGISNTVAFHLQLLLPGAAPVFNGPSPMTMLSHYLMLELQSWRVLPPTITKGLWDCLDGVLAIGRQAPTNYLNQSKIDHANEQFSQTALEYLPK